MIPCSHAFLYTYILKGLILAGCGHTSQSPLMLSKWAVNHEEDANICPFKFHSSLGDVLRNCSQLDDKQVRLCSTTSYKIHSESLLFLLIVVYCFLLFKISVCSLFLQAPLHNIQRDQFSSQTATYLSAPQT